MNSSSTRPPFKLICTESQRVLRRCSEVTLGAASDTSDASDEAGGGNSLNGNNNNMNLKQDYDNAIECLKQCECLINSMEHQLESRDEHIANLEKKAEAATKDSAADSRLRKEELAAKDARIEALEGQLVSMSLELACTKARQDKLQHKLKSSSVVSVSPSNNGSSNNANASFAIQQQQQGSSMPALNDGAVYKPASNRRRRNRQTFAWFGIEMEPADAAAVDDATTTTTFSPPDASASRRASCSSVKKSFTSNQTSFTSNLTSFTSNLTSFTSNQTSFTSLEANSSFNSGLGDLDKDSVGPSKFIAFGQLLGLRGGSNRRGFGDNSEVYFPPKAIQEDESKEEGEEEANSATAAFTAAPMATPWWSGGNSNSNEKKRQAEARASELKKAMPKQPSKKDLKMTFAQRIEAAVPSKSRQQHFGLQAPTKTGAGAASNGNFNNNGNGRRAANPRRNAMRKSSRSFLEDRGVVFPVSSFEVLNKGCSGMSPGDDAGGGEGLNSEWPEFQ